MSASGGGGRRRKRVAAGDFRISDEEAAKILEGMKETERSRSSRGSGKSSDSREASTPSPSGSSIPKTIQEQLDQLQYLISRGLNDEVGELVMSLGRGYINAEFTDGATPLTFAVAKAKPEIVDMLVKAGADPRIPNRFGQYAVHFAVASKPYREDIIENIINAGADINAQDRLGQTPLMLAIYSKISKVFEYLLANGADVNLESKSKQTALMYAARAGASQKTIDLLMARGASVNARDADGKTALMHALDVEGARDIKLAQRLIDHHGADCDMFNEKGKSVLDYAIETEGPTASIVKKIRKLSEAGKGAEVGSKRGRSWTQSLEAKAADKGRGRGEGPGL
ncbi:MAG: ankyrin repeat domain-containing protein [Rickettsiales bacterium]